MKSTARAIQTAREKRLKTRDKVVGETKHNALYPSQQFQRRRRLKGKKSMPDLLVGSLAGEFFHLFADC